MEMPGEGVIKSRDELICYTLGELVGLAGSVHEDVDHYRLRARDLAKLIRRERPIPEKQKK